MATTRQNKTQQDGPAFVRTGITWHNGRRVWFAAYHRPGLVISRRADSEREALESLEAGVNRVSDHPVYLFNF